jgi:hypothetical protein
MRLFYFILFVLLLGSCREMMDETPVDPEQFSVRLLDAIRKEGLYRAKLDTLSNSSIVVLSEILDSDSEKKAFWVNMYNALVQIRLHETPAQFEKKELFFEEDHIKVGSARLSLKDIESGLLNREFPQDFPKNLKILAVKKADPRTYFALNCGAISCPPIAFYSSYNIEKQLDLSQKVFISGSSHFDPFSNELTISEFIQWHEDELGGKEGIVKLHKKYGMVPQFLDPEIQYTPYDWSPNAGNFTD